MYYLGIGGVLNAIILTIVIVIALFTHQLFTTSSIIGTTVGGILGPTVIIFLKNKYKNRPGKIKAEINRVVDTYGNTTMAWIVIAVYIIAMDFLFLMYNNFLFNLGDLLVNIFFSSLITFSIYLGISFSTALSKYKRLHKTS